MDIDPELLSALQQDPQLMSQILGLGENSGKQELVGRQMAQADAMRGTKMPEGRQAGRLFVASNPLEVLGSVGSQAVGGYMGKQAEGNQAGLLKEQTGGRKAFMEQLINALRQRSPTQTFSPDAPLSAPEMM
jgi:hypothetical protein